MFRIGDFLTKSITHLRLRDCAGVLWRRAALVVIAVAVLLATYWPAQAAMELMFFRAESTDSSVLLSWATAREIDVEGFIILCKLASEPESAYHFIGQRAAMGGPEQPAEYSFAVTEDVYYGEQYCFRLEEVTTNDEPGEKRDICGYGPGVTPTPDVGGVPVGAVGALTPIVVTPLPGQSPAPTLITPGPTPTWTPIGQSPLETPTLDPFATATATQPISPLGAAGVTETLTPTVTPTVTPIATASPTTTQPTSPQDTPTMPPTATLIAATGGGDGLLAEQPSAAAGALAGGAGPTPTPMFIVVTATPTTMAVAAAPSLTPLPTATAAPDLGLLSVVSPTAQNMMVMMLCLIFLERDGSGDARPRDDHPLFPFAITAQDRRIRVPGPAPALRCARSSSWKFRTRRGSTSDGVRMKSVAPWRNMGRTFASAGPRSRACI